ncbi:hypothetical protein GALMADRAFT_797296 [Galerina marginata CBS 339.88]|uniref:Uncharacterized protein n=1 Tax=Galerina marginata (strain CBS 339.88) TaxID=685588 RepID=A0A067SMJ4_GALM3|nr:hypothetical protein GALMADRAFT_797296 [Galerina marginata CBS 339.88]
MMVAFNSRMRINKAPTSAFTFPFTSQGPPTHLDVDLNLGGLAPARGALITREEISFAPSSEILPDKKNFEDVRWADTSDQLSAR